MKLNLILFLVLIIFALLKVNSEHVYRKSFNSLDDEKKAEIELREEKNKLDLEMSDQSGDIRVEDFAKSKLNMIEPDSKKIKTIKNE
ncbi:MAG: cell division protein FtsL [Nitrosomonadales bacterium]